MTVETSLQETPKVEVKPKVEKEPKVEEKPVPKLPAEPSKVCFCLS